MFDALPWAQPLPNLSGFPAADVSISVSQLHQSVWKRGNTMKLRFFAGSILALTLAVSATLGQGRGGGGNQGGCYNPEVKVVINPNTVGIWGDGLEYTGTLFACGSNDVTFGHSDDRKNRSVFFNLDGRIPGSYAPAQESWLTGVQQFKGGFNVHRLGLIRTAATPTTTWMTGQFDGPDRKTYRLRMTPREGTQTGPTELLAADVNEPFDTSPVEATFVPSCNPNCTDNPYGKWEIVGAYQKVDEDTGATYDQIGTIYRVANTWIKMGQFELPFQMTIRLLRPYPTECPTC